MSICCWNFSNGFSALVSIDSIPPFKPANKPSCLFSPNPLQNALAPSEKLLPISLSDLPNKLNLFNKPSADLSMVTMPFPKTPKAAPAAPRTVGIRPIFSTNAVIPLIRAAIPLTPPLRRLLSIAALENACSEDVITSKRPCNESRYFSFSAAAEPSAFVAVSTISRAVSQF